MDHIIDQAKKEMIEDVQWHIKYHKEKLEKYTAQLLVLQKQ